MRPSIVRPRRFRGAVKAPAAATGLGTDVRLGCWSGRSEDPMNNIIWLVGAVVIVLAILSFFGLR